MSKNHFHHSHFHPKEPQGSLHSPKFYLIVALIVAFSVLGISKVSEWATKPQICPQDAKRCPDGKKAGKSVDSSGISGKIFLSPTCPGPEKTGESCVKPYQATVLVKSKDGAKEITRFSSDKDGQFQVDLPVGQYLLEPTATGSGRFPRTSPQLVGVEENKYTEIIIGYDTGMR